MSTNILLSSLGSIQHDDAPGVYQDEVPPREQVLQPEVHLVQSLDGQPLLLIGHVLVGLVWVTVRRHLRITNSILRR